MKPQHLVMSLIAVVAASASATYADSASPITITLKAVNPTFNESGTAVLSPTDHDSGSTTVNITISNEPSGETQYVFFQYGTCPNNLFFDVIYPLNDLVNGTSTSIYDVPLFEMLKVGPMDGGGADKGTETPPPTAAPMAHTPHSHFGPRPTSFAVAIWRYTTSGKTLVSCGDQPLTGQPNFVHFQ